MTFKISNGLDFSCYEVERIHPFGLEDFYRENLVLKFEGTKRNKSENFKSSEFGVFKNQIKHHLILNTFNLVDGGWLPPAYCLEGMYILDRNIVSNFESDNSIKCKEFNDWFEVIKLSDTVKMSTIFSAVERREIFPCFSEFMSGIEEDAKSVVKFLPKCNTLEFDAAQIGSIYKFILNMRSQNYVDFLLEAIPIIHTQKPKNDNKLICVDQLIELAKKHQLNGRVHLLILCLSCLYEGNEKHQKFARGIIKPKRLYTNKMAFNCVNDVIFLDVILLLKHAFYPSISGTTSDKNLAMYWCALNPIVVREAETLKFDVDLGDTLFPLASQIELDYLNKSLKSL